MARNSAQMCMQSATSQLQCKETSSRLQDWNVLITKMFRCTYCRLYSVLLDQSCFWLAVVVYGAKNLRR